MFRPRSIVASLAVSLTTLLSLACSSPPEEPILRQFFRASQLRDRTSLGSFAVAVFEPNTHGTVSSFKIRSVTPERRTPLALKALAREHDDARAADAAFTTRKIAYQRENMEAISRVLKIENAKGKVAGKDAEVQAAWTKFREETAEHSKKLAEARRKLTSESSVVKLSLEDPNNPVDATKSDGDMVSKDVTIEAPVKTPDGRTAQKTLVVTMQRAVLKGTTETVGRWIITSVKDTSGLPAGKTS